MPLAVPAVPLVVPVVPPRCAGCAARICCTYINVYASLSWVIVSLLPEKTGPITMNNETKLDRIESPPMIRAFLGNGRRESGRVSKVAGTDARIDKHSQIVHITVACRISHQQPGSGPKARAWGPGPEA